MKMSFPHFVILIIVVITTAFAVENCNDQDIVGIANNHIDKPFKEERWFWAVFSVFITILGFSGSVAGTTWFGQSKATEPLFY